MIRDCLSILIRRETPVIVAYVDKHEFGQAHDTSEGAGTHWQNPTEPAINRFLFALNMFMDELSMSNLDHAQLMESAWPTNDFALVIARDGGSVEPRFMGEYLKSDDGRDSTAVLENFCFVDVQNSVGIQLANMCAYFTRRWLGDPSAPNPYFEALRDGKVIQVIYPVHL